MLPSKTPNTRKGLQFLSYWIKRSYRTPKPYRLTNTIVYPQPHTQPDGKTLLLKTSYTYVTKLIYNFKYFLGGFHDRVSL